MKNASFNKTAPISSGYHIYYLYLIFSVFACDDLEKQLDETQIVS